MNSKHHVRHSAAILAALAVLTLVLPRASLAQEKSPKARERIGVYDSRAVAVAFAGSAIQAEQLKDLRAAHQKAKDAGDSREVARLEARGKAWQQKAYQQGFSTAPVDDLLAHITNALPAIQKAAAATALVSKWDEAGLRKHAGAETVDVTMALVEAFHPNERQQKHAIEIQKRKPISLKQASRIKD